MYSNTIEQAKYLISMNENMKSILDKYGGDNLLLQTTPLLLRLNKYIERGIEKRKDVNCYTYKSNKHFELFYPDSTGNEFSNNKVYIEANEDVAETLRMSLRFAFAIAKLLDNISNKFNIVVSYADTDFTVSFYCKRDSEEWLTNDLDSYTEEAILVITT